MKIARQVFNATKIVSDIKRRIKEEKGPLLVILPDEYHEAVKKLLSAEDLHNIYFGSEATKGDK